ncbi:MAG: hypothetical protein B7Z30_00550 [Rhizobiales bacterium 12-68-15]|nr:MAG: hypothetical protein B7Z30_00550 [Rhizobiales bacterium 12-68-15]
METAVTTQKEPRTEPSSPFDVSELDVDHALAECDGDPRATIRALLVGQAYLEQQIQRLASSGYSRSLPLARLIDVQG